MSFYKQYNPYQWPPNIMLADLHSRCSMPGKENPQGQQCPCCMRRTRLRTNNWLFRDIYKDFKNYGGGIPGYFSLLFYYGCALLCIIIGLSTFYLYSIHKVCHGETLQTYKCVKVFGFFKLMVLQTLLHELDAADLHTYSEILQFLLFLNFLFLLGVNFMAHYYLKKVENRMIKRKHVISQFALFLKNIKKSETLDSLRSTLRHEMPNVQIREIFFLYKTSELQQYYNKTIDSYFLLKFYRDQKDIKALTKQQQTFINCYHRMKMLEKKLSQNSGRAIVVFEQINEKAFFKELFHMGTMAKFLYNTGKLFKYNTIENEVYADNMSEPSQMIWAHAGDSSVKKTRVRIITTFISIAYLVVCYAVMFYPMKLASKERDATTVYLINFAISIVLFIMNITYRSIMENLSLRRKPNTYLSKSKFVVLTTVLFHILFYLYIPAFYYFKQSSTEVGALKLATLFTQVLIFLFVSTVIALIDTKYCAFSGLRRKLLSKVSQSHKLCQRRLHEKLTFPSFYIEFKLMILYKIWSFSAFYSFQIPQVSLLMVILMTFLYWNDKKNIYTHYKMQSYLPIQLERQFQDVYIFVFMVTLCLSYMTVATRDWQRFVAVALTFVVLILKILFDESQKRNEHKEDEIRKGARLGEAMANYVPPRISIIPGIPNTIDSSQETSFSPSIVINKNIDNKISTLPLSPSIQKSLLKQPGDQVRKEFQPQQILISSEYEEPEMPDQSQRPFATSSKVNSLSSYLETTSLKSISHLSNGYQEAYDRYLHHFKSKKVHDMLRHEYEHLMRESHQQQQRNSKFEKKIERRESELVDMSAQRGTGE